MSQKSKRMHGVPGTHGAWPQRRKKRRSRPALGSRILQARAPKIDTYNAGDLVKLLGHKMGSQRGG